MKRVAKRIREWWTALSFDKYDAAGVAGVASLVAGSWIVFGPGWSALVFGALSLAFGLIGSR